MTVLANMTAPQKAEFALAADAAAGYPSRLKRAEGWGIVSNRPNNYGHTGIAVATAGTMTTYRVAHKNASGKTIVSIRLGYPHQGLAGGTEASNTNGIQVKSAMEFSGTVADQSQARTPVMFRGARVPTIAPRGLIWSDPVPCFWAPGTTVFERAGVTVDTNGGSYFRGTYLRGGTAAGGDNTGEGFVTGTDAVDSGNTTSTVGNAYSAVAIIGLAIDGSIIECIHGDGDSIFAGEDDGGLGNHGGGHFNRAFDNYPHSWGALGGEALNQILTMTNYLVRWEVSKFATKVVNGHGRNDLAQGRTAMQIRADVLAEAYRRMIMGVDFIKTTILPEPGSNNGWFDMAGQIAAGKSSFDGQRVLLNQWIRDPSASGFVAQANAQVAGAARYVGKARFVNTCLFIECGADGVLANDGGYVLPATTLYDSGNPSVGGAALLTDTTKSWTVNAWRERSIAIIGGTGAGQSRCIISNTATTISYANAFNPALDTTSQYQITDAMGFTGTTAFTGAHGHTRLHKAAAQAYDVAAIMAPPV